MIGIESNASRTRRTTTEAAEIQGNPTASKAATATNKISARALDSQKRAAVDRCNDETDWREVTQYKRERSCWNDPRCAQKRTRRNNPCSRVEDIRTRKVEDPTAGTRNGGRKANQAQVSWYSMCASEDEKDACETNTEAPPRIATEHHDDQDAEQGKQCKEEKGESEKTSVHSKEKTGDHSLTGEEEGETTNLAARVLKLAKGLSKYGRDDRLQRGKHG